MNKAVVIAWFCDKCHGYNKMKTVPVPMKSGSEFQSREVCYRCGKVQQCDVRVDYWGDKKGEIIMPVETNGENNA